MKEWLLWSFLLLTGFWMGAATMYWHFHYNRLIRSREEWHRAMQKAMEEEE